MLVTKIMCNDNLKDYIKKDKFQVFLLSSPCSIPISFARHHWFVLNKKGELHRYEVLHWKNGEVDNSNYLHKNSINPFHGLGILPFTNKYSWESRIECSIEGDENSTAKLMIDFIEAPNETYPYCNKYSFFGPNSNTYVQFALNKFPEFKTRLSWNSFGKNFISK